MTMLIAYMSIFEVQSKENIENQLKPTNIGESYRIRGGGEKIGCFCRKGTRVMMRESVALKASK